MARSKCWWLRDLQTPHVKLHVYTVSQFANLEYGEAEGQGFRRQAWRKRTRRTDPLVSICPKLRSISGSLIVTPFGDASCLHAVSNCRLGKQSAEFPCEQRLTTQPSTMDELTFRTLHRSGARRLSLTDYTPQKSGCQGPIPHDSVDAPARERLPTLGTDTAPGCDFLPSALCVFLTPLNNLIDRVVAILAGHSSGFPVGHRSWRHVEKPSNAL